MDMDKATFAILISLASLSLTGFLAYRSVVISRVQVKVGVLTKLFDLELTGEHYISKLRYIDRKFNNILPDLNSKIETIEKNILITEAKLQIMKEAYGRLKDLKFFSISDLEILGHEIESVQKRLHEFKIPIQELENILAEEKELSQNSH